MTRSVLVIGGGPAGLAAAVHLAEHGFAVTLAEEQDRLCSRLHDHALVLLGGHRTTHALLRSSGSFRRRTEASSVRLELAHDHRLIPLRRPWLPGRLHGVLALATFRGLGVSDRWRALGLLERSWEGVPALPADLDAWTADAWLADRGQSRAARTGVWDPLARFFLGNDLTAVSAAQFARTLNRYLLSSRRAAGLTIGRQSTPRLLVEPMTARLRAGGGDVRLNTAATRIGFDHDRITGVHLSSGETLSAQWYVLALPHRNVCSLLPDRLLTRYTYFEQLTRLSDAPAVVVRLWMDGPTPCGHLVLLARHSFHWIVAPASFAGRHGRAQITLIAADCRPLLHQSDHALFELARADLKHAFPGHHGACNKYDIVRDAHAFLSLLPGVAMLRPLPQSPIRNLLLAGAWTDTGLPATLESAVVSGLHAAQAIHAQDG